IQQINNCDPFDAVTNSKLATKDVIEVVVEGDIADIVVDDSIVSFGLAFLSDFCFTVSIIGGDGSRYLSSLAI
ncbi:2774_t:CDS:2, partial [Gigaspora rosea]